MADCKPQHKNPFPGDHEIYNFGIPVVIITIYFFCLIYVMK